MYTTIMLCHVTLPYLWEECDNSIESCAHAVHAEGSIELLNAYPIEWAEKVFSFKSETVDDHQVLLCLNSQDELHNVDGPAVESSDGTLMWFQHAGRHRLGGPAVIEADGSLEWWVHGELHRVGGPAIIHADGSEEWWLNGEQYHAFGPVRENDIVSGQFVDVCVAVFNLMRD